MMCGAPRPTPLWISASGHHLVSCHVSERRSWTSMEGLRFLEAEMTDRTRPIPVTRWLSVVPPSLAAYPTLMLLPAASHGQDQNGAWDARQILEQKQFVSPPDVVTDAVLAPRYKVFLPRRYLSTGFVHRFFLLPKFGRPHPATVSCSWPLPNRYWSLWDALNSRPLRVLVPLERISSLLWTGS